MPPQPRRTPKPGRQTAATAGLRQQAPLEVVDPVWLLKAVVLTVAGAVVCAWLALCLLYYQGSWQLVLHPVHTVDRTPAALGIGFDAVRFDAAETGQPRLAGWWIPAESAAGSSSARALQSPSKYGELTVLLLHDGTGSLSATVPTIVLLHRLGVTVFAMDYRGFGTSDSTSHPTSASMMIDTQAAFDYLETIRHIPASAIVPYGIGLGASLAARLAEGHREVPGVILDNPDPDPAATADDAHPSHLIPIRLLYHEHFEILDPLRSLSTSKLLIAGGDNAAAAHATPGSLQGLFRAAGSPKYAVVLPSVDSASGDRDAVARFLDSLPALPR